MPIIHNCIIHIFEIDSEVPISDYVGNWILPGIGKSTSCHNISETELECTRGIQISIVGRSLTTKTRAGLHQGYLGIDGKITWKLNGRVTGRWTRLGTLSIINHKL